MQHGPGARELPPLLKHLKPGAAPPPPSGLPPEGSRIAEAVRGLPKQDLWAEPARKFRSRHLQDLQELSQKRKDSKAVAVEKELRALQLKEKLRNRVLKSKESK